MGSRRLRLVLPWRAVALVCFVALVVLALTAWSAEAMSQAQPPPPTDTPSPPTSTPGGPTPPPTATAVPPQPPAPGGAPVIKFKGILQPPSGPAPTKFAINGCALVVRPPNLSLSEEPGFGKAHIQNVEVGQQVQIVGGPVGADSLWWWQFRSLEGKVGWGVGDYADPSTDPCGAAEVTVPVLGKLPLTGAGSEWLIPAVALAVLLIVVAIIRRRRMRATVDKS